MRSTVYSAAMYRYMMETLAEMMYGRLNISVCMHLPTRLTEEHDPYP